MGPKEPPSQNHSCRRGRVEMHVFPFPLANRQQSESRLEMIGNKGNDGRP
jgi:hypothetical protein